MTNFLDLQNGWYNGFIQGLDQNEDSFQIIQPAPPIANDTVANTIFWSYYNNIPPISLSQHYQSSGGNQFYNDYRALLSVLEPATNINVQKDIGDANYTAWKAYIQSTGYPDINKLPTLFRNWAIFNCPEKANIGSSDYAAILLDPIATAQNELTLIYTDANGLPLPFDWILTYNTMVNQLKSSPSRSFDFNSAKMNTNVKSSWSEGSNSAFFGLWGSSSSDSKISQQFASSNVKISAQFHNILVFSNTPGSWYYSGALGLAYANKTGAPWRSGAAINWNNTFGKPNGNLQYFAANLVIASGMDITITSDASYSKEDQETITSSSGGGFWPFYCGGGSSSSTNKATFSESGQLTIKTSSLPGVPIVLGANVLSAGEFTGHSAQTAQALYATSKQFKKVKEPVLS